MKKLTAAALAVFISISAASAVKAGERRTVLSCNLEGHSWLLAEIFCGGGGEIIREIYTSARGTDCAYEGRHDRRVRGRHVTSRGVAAWSDERIRIRSEHQLACLD